MLQQHPWSAPALSGCWVLGVRLELVHVTHRNTEGVQIRSLTGVASLSVSAALSLVHVTNIEGDEYGPSKLMKHYRNLIIIVIQNFRKSKMRTATYEYMCLFNISCMV